MKIYLTRALHYFLKIAVILAVAFGVLYLAGLLNVPPGQFFQTFFMTARGWIIIALVVVLSLSYPALSFTTVDIVGDFDRERELLDRAVAQFDFRASVQDREHAEYRLKSFAGRLFCQFDDRVTVRGEGRFISISGPKKYVGRIETYFMHYRTENESTIK